MTTYTAIPDADIDTDSPITQSLMTLLRDNPLGIQEGASGAPRIVRGAIAAGVGHRWFFDYGDESDGAITHTSSTTIAPGLWQCTTFEISATSPITTVGLNAMGPLIICATTSITINGVLDVDGDGARGGDGDTTAGNYGQPGMFGGSGGGAGTGSLDGGPTFLTAGGLGASSGNGNSQSTRTLNTLLSLMPIFAVTRKLTATQLHEYNGESSADAAVGGGGGAGSSNNHNGGNGGGLVVLCAPVITVGAAGVITADGTAGTGTYNGGGGGGAIIIATPSGGYTNNGSVAAAGGVSSSGGNGGTGIAPVGSTPTVTLT